MFSLPQRSKKGFIAAALVFASLPFSAFAEWSPRAVEIVQKTNQQKFYELSVYAGSRWRQWLPYAVTENDPFGQVVYSKITFSKTANLERFISPGQRIRLPLESQFFALKPEGAMLSPQDRDSLEVTAYLQNEHKDLVVIIPGIFSGSDHKETLFIASRFAERGKHVIVLPSPFVNEYLDRFPFHSPGSFETEAKLILEAIGGFKSVVPRVNKVHLIGVSYGAFLAAIALEHDSRHGSNHITGETILISPQARLYYSLALLDQFMNDLRPGLEPLAAFEATNGSRITVGRDFFLETVRFNIQMMRNFAFQRSLSFQGAAKQAFDPRYVLAKGDLWPVVRLNFESIEIQAGVSLDQASLSAWEEHFTTFPDLRNARDRLAGGLKLWSQQLRFVPTIQGLTAENLRYYRDGLDRIGYWLERVPHRRFKILTAKNDFTNRFQDWSNPAVFPQELVNERFFLAFEHGSHGGFVVWENFVTLTNHFFE